MTCASFLTIMFRQIVGCAVTGTSGEARDSANSCSHWSATVDQANRALLAGIISRRIRACSSGDRRMLMSPLSHSSSNVLSSAGLVSS